MKFRNSRSLSATVIMFTICLLMVTAPVSGAEKKNIKFASVSWTGVTIKTNLGEKILDLLGYDADNTVLPVPLVYKSLESGDIDIFLGNWMPSMETIANKFFDNGSVIKYVANMPGAKYTLAAPTYAVEGGLKDFSDIARFRDKLDGKIYGLEPGNDGNLIIKNMIDSNMFGLGGFKLVETSEPMMLAEVKALATEKKWVVFLGWAPHYMNTKIDMTYLTGSTADTFGDHNGTATVYTNIRKGFDEEYPNVATFLQNFTFSIDMMNEVMEMMKDDKSLDHLEAGLAWLKKHPDTYRKWLTGVKTADGNDALPVFEAYLKTI